MNKQIDDVDVTAAVPSQNLVERYSEDNAESIKSGGRHFLIRNADRLSFGQEKDGSTAVILGLARSGTTMTAGVMQILGVKFGDRINRRGGDRDIGKCFDEVRDSFMRWRVIFLRRRFARVIKERNRQSRDWAFKAPPLVEYTWLLTGTLRNPVYIVPIRNPFSTSFGFAEHTKGNWRKAIFSVPFLQLFLLLFCLWTRRPVFFFSYEHANKDSSLFVDLLAEFLTLEPSAEIRQKACAYIDPALGYRSLQRLEGFVDSLDGTRLQGWVTDTEQMDTPVALQVTVAGKVIATGQADGMRPDVREQGRHSTGVCGFDIPFETALSDEQLRQVVVHVPALQREFWRPSS